jgi:CubicO group peptidase (beta-lactamase class C family)
MAARTPAALALEGFDAFVEATLKDWTVPGVGVAVVKDGEVLLSRGYGLRDVARGLEVTPQTIFAIGSSSKAFTSMALALLVDDGKLDWDTPLRTYLPTFKLYDAFATERMTPRDLVTHRSGLPRHDLMWYRSPFSRKEIFDRLQYLQPSKDFRALWQYQNLMYMTAGYLVEQLSGRTWEEFVVERIFQPLGMERSNVSVEVSRQAADVALPYKEEDDTLKEIPFANIDTIGPAGSINSSVEDMTQWLLLHLSDGMRGDRRIVSSGQLAQMHTPQMVIEQGVGLSTKFKETPHVSYALGWFVQPYRGHTMIHHGGNIDGFSAMVAFLPDEKTGVVALTNGNGNPVPIILALNAFDRLLGLDQVPWNDRYKEEMAEIKEAAERGKQQSASSRVEGQAPSHELSAYVGEYEHPGYGILSVARDGDTLTASYNNLQFALAHYHYDVFEMTYELFDIRLKALFSTNVKGDIDSLAVPLEPTVPDIVFKRRPPAHLLNRAALERFTGDYELMGMPLRVTLKGDTALLISLQGQPDHELRPYKDMQFELTGLSGFSITFKADDSGAVTELLVTQPNGTFTARRA